MKYKIIQILSWLLTVSFSVLAQKIDTGVFQLKEFSVRGYKSMNGVGHINDYSGQIIYAGKKNEVLVIDSLEANKAMNNTRQILGRIPGLNIIESEAGGFTANGIGFRGLNPYQSIEMNTRQNGYNISADIFGYNEAYYLPPMEAVESIQFLRGAAGLQFGPQVGGLVNYVIKEAPNKPVEVNISQTLGNYGLYSIYNSVGGTIGKWKYFAFIQDRTMEGWRNNSDQQQLSGFGKLSFQASEKIELSVEYSFLRNKIHMPGGLNDSEFNLNPRMSLRARNWLQSPWNILSATIKDKISDKTSLSFTSSYQFSQRDLIWQNEDSWYPNFLPDSAGIARELEKEYFNNISNEIRLLTNYQIGNVQNTLAFGFRQAFSQLTRYEGGTGSTRNNLDLTAYEPYTTAITFTTNNISLFAENIFRLSPKLSITPGFRLEYLSTAANGYSENKDTSTNIAIPELKIKQQNNQRAFLLGGVGLQYEFSSKINAYSNISQSYRPVTYSNLTPFGTTANIDPNLKDCRAIDGDFGLRGKLKNYLNFDVNTFWLYVYDGIGTVNKTEKGINISYVTNTGASLHKGFESYVELNLSELLFQQLHLGKISLYNSLAYVDAVYTDGAYKGNRVEYAPKIIERIGLNYNFKKLELNYQFSFQDKSFGDASNSIYTASAESGIIPSFMIMDVSASYKWNKYKISFGVNNLTDAQYFSFRTSEYPGPGIIPSNGRMYYGGLSMKI